MIYNYKIFSPSKLSSFLHFRNEEGLRFPACFAVLAIFLVSRMTACVGGVSYLEIVRLWRLKSVTFWLSGND